MSHQKPDDAPTKYKYNGVEFNIWNDNPSAGPDGWSVYPKSNYLAPLQYKDVSKGDLIEELERLIDEDEWPEPDDLDDQEKRAVTHGDRREV